MHGRDILAPVAAQIANGRGLQELGPKIEDVRLLNAPSWAVAADGVAGEIIAIDHFGNAITNLPERLFSELAYGVRFQVAVDGRESEWTWCAAYGLTPPRTPVTLVGSSGHLELAVNCGSAASELHLRESPKVLIRKPIFGWRVIIGSITNRELLQFRLCSRGLGGASRVQICEGCRFNCREKSSSGS